jgi:serine protease AprX
MHKNASVKLTIVCIWLLLQIAVLFSETNAQIRKVIFLKDKNQTAYSLSKPLEYLSPRAIDRRARYNIAIDSSDLPVNPAYINTIAGLNNLNIIGASKWLNAIIVECSDAATLMQISNLPFVQNVQNIALRKTRSSERKNIIETVTSPAEFNSRRLRNLSDVFDYGPAEGQIKMHNGHLLHNIGAQGEGMLIAFFDAGYFQFNNNRFVDSARLQGRIMATRDFYSNDDLVSDDDAHGLFCLSAVGGNIPGEYVGSAPLASFLLLKTEDVRSEQIIEEYMWGLGAEFADSCGADVFSSSVGYTTFDDPLQNHNYNELDGNTAIVTRMADKAASKGILVVTSAGNEGGSSWKYIGTPADGDSVFAVGAVNAQKQIAGFSSFGPTSDGRIKPNVVGLGVGTALAGTNQSVIYSSGTSYSTPTLAGLMACFWQFFPELNNAQLMKLIQASSDRYPSPDPQYGYGIPDMAKALATVIQKKAGMDITLSECNAEIKWQSFDTEGMAYVIQKKYANETNYTPLDTFYAIRKKWGISNYLFQDNFIDNDAAYRIIQVLDTSRIKPINFILDSAAVSVTGLCKNKDITLFPNPAKNSFTIKFGMISGYNKLQVDIMNSQGQQIKTIHLSKPTGLFISPPININGLSKGTYIVNISENHNRLFKQKLIVQ